jgi:heat shock protein HslJ
MRRPAIAIAIAIAQGLLLASCVSAEPATTGAPLDVTGAWKLVTIAGAPVLSGANPTLTLGADGAANGYGSCNAFGGSYTRQGDTLSFSRMISTMMACTRPNMSSQQVMGQEHRFLSALNGGVAASEPETNVLVLTTPNGEALRFERAP